MRSRRQPATTRIADGLVFYTEGLATLLPTTIHGVEVVGDRNVKVTASVGHRFIGQPDNPQRFTFTMTFDEALAADIIERI